MSQHSTHTEAGQFPREVDGLPEATSSLCSTSLMATRLTCGSARSRSESGLLRVAAFSGGLVSLGLLTVTIIGFNVN